MFEIERKYLLKEGSEHFISMDFLSQFNSLNSLINKIQKYGVIIRQGYLSKEQGIGLAKKLGLVVDFVPAEARVRQKGDKYFFTLKSIGSEKRHELESLISQELFENIYSLTNDKRVEKKRLNHKIKELIYEFDYYLDRDLIVVEVEVDKESDLNKIISLGKDVTQDKKYKNKNLAK